MKLKRLLAFVLTVVMVIGCMSIYTFAETSTYLDLESTATYADKKDVDQNYTFKQTGNTTYTNVTKVKLEWAITDIAATYTSNKTWDPENLVWVDTKTVSDIADKTATFTLTNYSSKAVKANAAFAVETSLSATYDAENSSFDNNDCTVATPVKQDDTTYQDSDFTALAQTITATLKFNKDEFAELSAVASAAKYGTYTITISEVPTVTWNPLSVEITTTTGKEIVNYYPVLGETNPQPDKFAYSTDGVTFTEIQKTSDVYTMSDVATYAKAGQLYYQGGSVNTVRSVNDISWNNTFNDNSGYTYPYYASTAYNYLQSGIKEKIAADGSETVEKLAMETSGAPTAPPTINGVSIVDIWNIYNSNEESSGFGSEYGSFLSCVARSSTNATYAILFGGYWDTCPRSSSNDYCVLISRTFN